MSDDHHAGPARWFRLSNPLGSGFEGQSYLLKWLFVGTVIGVAAGLGAAAFYYAIGLATRLTLGKLAGYVPPSPIGEGSPAVVPIGHPWVLPLVTMAGGLISGLIVFGLAPEAEGHGTDAAIDAIHRRRGFIRLRIPPIKLVASAITIGTGGSGGREGPAAQISAGIGSLLGRVLKLSDMDRRIAVSAGIGAGIGAIFRAPLGGAILAAEILYLHDLEVEAIIPALIASIVGYSICGIFYGFTPIFGAQPNIDFSHPIQLVYYAILGVLCGAFGILYATSFYKTTDLFHHLHIPRIVKPAIGGLIVGLIGLAVPQALHMGYGWVQIAMGPGLFTIPLWIVIALPAIKILATSLSIGSGGSGGIFGPGMVIGGMLGASFWRLTVHLLPGMPVQPAPFVIVGMMAMFGGIAHAPLAVMLMVAEMAGNLSLLAPAMVAVAISTALVGNHTIYRAQLPTRAQSPAHRLRMSFPLIASLSARDAMEPGGTAEAGAPSVDADDTLDVALERIASTGSTWVAVREKGRAVGRLSVAGIMQRYHAAMAGTVRRTEALPAESVLLQAGIDEKSALAGVRLSDAKLPPGVLVVSVSRGAETILPVASTRIAAGDVLLVMTGRAQEQAARAALGTGASDGANLQGDAP